MNNIMIKLSPTFIFIIGFIGVQFLPTNYGLFIFVLLVVGYIFGISVFLERYRGNGEFKDAISVNLFLLFISIFGVMSFLIIRIVLEEILWKNYL